VQAPIPCQLDAEDFILRFLHSSRVNPDGSVNSGAFSLRADPELSVAIEKLIPAESMERFCALKIGQGLAKVRVDEIRALGLDARPDKEPEWGDFADAHAVITGHAQWSNNRKDEAARALRNAANAWGVVRPPTK